MPYNVSASTSQRPDHISNGGTFVTIISGERTTQITESIKVLNDPNIWMKGIELHTSRKPADLSDFWEFDRKRNLMTDKETRELGYTLETVSNFEVGLLKNNQVIRTWFFRDFNGEIPTLEHSKIQKAIQINERSHHDSERSHHD